AAWLAAAWLVELPVGDLSVAAWSGELSSAEMSSGAEPHAAVKINVVIDATRDMRGKDGRIRIMHCTMTTSAAKRRTQWCFDTRRWKSASATVAFAWCAGLPRWREAA